MRFLIDAQLSPRLTAQLERAGHVAFHVFHHLDPQADDLTVAELTNQLGASVISKDADFAELAARGLLKQTLVWVRVPNVTAGVLWARLDSSMPDIVAAAASGSRIYEVF